MANGRVQAIAFARELYSKESSPRALLENSNRVLGALVELYWNVLLQPFVGELSSRAILELWWSVLLERFVLEDSSRVTLATRIEWMSVNKKSKRVL